MSVHELRCSPAGPVGRTAQARRPARTVWRLKHCRMNPDRRDTLGYLNLWTKAYPMDPLALRVVSRRVGTSADGSSRRAGDSQQRAHDGQDAWRLLATLLE
jgi:hypothetical protein